MRESGATSQRKATGSGTVWRFDLHLGKHIWSGRRRFSSYKHQLHLLLLFRANLLHSNVELDRAWIANCLCGSGLHFAQGTTQSHLSTRWRSEFTSIIFFFDRVPSFHSTTFSASYLQGRHRGAARQATARCHLKVAISFANGSVSFASRHTRTLPVSQQLTLEVWIPDLTINNSSHLHDASPRSPERAGRGLRATQHFPDPFHTSKSATPWPTSPPPPLLR